MQRPKWLVLALAFTLSVPPGNARAQNELAIFAAASLKNALDEIATNLGAAKARAAFEKQGFTVLVKSTSSS